MRGQWLLKLVDGPPRRPTCHGLPATITGSGRITGTSRADVIVGSSGADTIDGRGGDDVICAGEGDDTVLQGDRPDGWDSIDGQGGVDTVSYARRTTPVRIDLRATGQPRSGATSSTPNSPDEIDALVAVENGVGGSAADILEGDGAANRLEGGPGSDTITGEDGDDVEIGGPGADTFEQGVFAGGGADLLLGRGGRDTVTYSLYGPAVTVVLDGLANDGAQGEGDNVSVEVVVGSIEDDTLVGDGSANWFYGGDGADTLVGGGGPDHLFGEAHRDVLDLRDGVGGNDLGDGGDATDTATWDPGDRLVAVP
ncbi:calcium-binding protein [Nocardioides sp. TF02-7]|uniref:calcium-binding protein n=1 Tax=Nocardioides sp. TF02-7 TaxID=2917724 RepID=UPI001F06A958|nr:calcium-binding protein [Nocardioides sp. TF02-7]UMG92899.1 hypothetical protein MF408_00480 [Nocardioides sp. TF02-7]